MKSLKDCKIEKTVNALEEAIENKKRQMQRMPIKSGPSLLLPNLFSAIFNKAEGSFAQMNNAWEQGRTFAQEFLKSARQRIQEKPWEVLRIVAIYSFSIGLFLGLRRKKSSEGRISNEDKE